jgi:hypothetical protein
VPSAKVAFRACLAFILTPMPSVVAHVAWRAHWNFRFFLICSEGMSGEFAWILALHILLLSVGY